MKQGRTQLGIHISDQDISLVAVNQDEGGLTISAWQRLPLEPDLVNGGRIQDATAIAQIITQFLNEHKLGPVDSVFSLTLNVARLKVASIKSSSDEELHEQVTSDLARYTPFGRENTYATYSIQKAPETVDTPTSVLEVMTSHCAGDNCLTTCLRAHMSAPMLEAAALPLIRVMARQTLLPADKVSLLCVMDADAGMLCVLQGGMLAFCRSLDIGVKTLVADRSLVASLREAVQPVVGYARSLSDQGLSMYVVADGPYDDLRTVTTRVRQCCKGIRVHQWGALQLVKSLGLTLPFEPKELPILAFAQALSTGEGVDEIDALNLIPPSSLEKISARRDMSRIGKAIAAVVILVVAIVIPVNIKTGRVEADSAAFESQIAAARPVQEKIQVLQARIEALRKQITLYQEGAAGMPVLPWHHMLEDLVASVQGGIRIKDIRTWPDGTFTIAGQAVDEAVVYQFATNLAAKSLVADADVEQVEYDHKSTHAVEYAIKAHLALGETKQP